MVLALENHFVVIQVFDMICKWCFNFLNLNHYFIDPDCADASDEIGCPKPDCSKNPLFWDHDHKFINCPHTTACIHPDWLCDGQVIIITL